MDCINFILFYFLVLLCLVQLLDMIAYFGKVFFGCDVGLTILYHLFELVQSHPPGNGIVLYVTGAYSFDATWSTSV